MGNYKNLLESVKSIADNAKAKNIAHLYAKTPHQGSIQIGEKSMVNFGSCSYLGLEFDERLKSGAKSAIDSYGTQFSASRAYVSCELYMELEKNLEKMTNCNVVVTPTTTLGHISTIPVIVGDDDVVILDHQVHASVQTAVQLLKARGIRIEMIRHNNMEMLEERIIKLQSKYKKIWYMADGIYSMYGDSADMTMLTNLMNKYTCFHLYIDDAHGTSCYGENGVGYVLSQVSMHKQMIVAISLNKAFASGGGAILFSDFETADLVRSCGGPMITSGPMQPASLGSAIAATKIHLSEQIEEFKNDLQENIKYANLIIKKLNLPLIAVNNSPIFFIGISVPKLGYELVSRMKSSGYYMNIGIFPAVPIKNTGIRFTITRLHSFKEINNMLITLKKHYFKILNEENYTVQNVYKAFKMKNAENYKEKSKNVQRLNKSELKFEHFQTISEIGKNDWDEIFDNEGAFNYETLLLYEKTFGNQTIKENRWEFDYVVIRDLNNKIVLSTFLTTCLQKDDIFSISEISQLIEKERKSSPHYLTSIVLSIGCGLSIGKQIYIDSNNRLWTNALNLFLDKLEMIKEKRKAEKIMLRGFDVDNLYIQTLVEEKGYFSMDLPENNIIKSFWENEVEFIGYLRSNRKRHYKRQIKVEENNFISKISNPNSNEEIEHLYKMYLNVWSNNKDLNTFALPIEFFNEIANHNDWEIIEIYEENKKESCGVLFTHISEHSISPLIIGTSTKICANSNLYRFVLSRILKQSFSKNIAQVFLGISNSSEKRKIGATQFKTKAYFQVSDHYNDSVIETYNKQVNLEKV